VFFLLGFGFVSEDHEKKKIKEKRTEQKGTERPKLNRICRKLAINFNFESDSPALIEVNQSVAAI